MARARIVRQDNKADLEATPGYAGSGEGQWSRHAANGTPVKHDPQIVESSHFDQIIAKNFRELRRLQQKLLTAEDPKVGGGLMRKIELKLEIIARCREQQKREEPKNV